MIRKLSAGEAFEIVRGNQTVLMPFSSTEPTTAETITLVTDGSMETALEAKASLESPAFSGSPTAPTPEDVADSSDSIATTKFVHDALSATVDDSWTHRPMVALEPTVGYVDGEFLPIVANGNVRNPMDTSVSANGDTYTLSVNSTTVAEFDLSGNFRSKYAAADEYSFNGHEVDDVTISFYDSERYVLDPFVSATISSDGISAVVDIGCGNFGAFSEASSYMPYDVVVHGGGLWECVKPHTASTWDESHFSRISRDMWVTFRGNLESVVFGGGFDTINGEGVFTADVLPGSDSVHHVVEYDGGRFSYSADGLHGSELPKSPTQRQIADALKALWVLNGGTIGA